MAAEKLDRCVTIGKLTVYLDNWTVKYEDKTVDLAKKEFLLIKRLAEALSATVHHHDLKRSVYKNKPVVDNTYRILVMRTRRALASEGAKDVIETVPNRGYRLIDPVHAA